MFQVKGLISNIDCVLVVVGNEKGKLSRRQGETYTLYQCGSLICSEAGDELLSPIYSSDVIFPVCTSVHLLR